MTRGHALSSSSWGALFVCPCLGDGLSTSDSPYTTIVGAVLASRAGTAGAHRVAAGQGSNVTRRPLQGLLEAVHCTHTGPVLMTAACLSHCRKCMNTQKRSYHQADCVCWAPHGLQDRQNNSMPLTGWVQLQTLHLQAALWKAPWASEPSCMLRAQQLMPTMQQLTAAGSPAT
jgi:hypothetical protein